MLHQIAYLSLIVEIIMWSIC